MKVISILEEKQQLNEVAPAILGAIALAKTIATTVAVGLAVDVAVNAIAGLIIDYQKKSGAINKKTLVPGMKITDAQGRTYAWSKTGEWWQQVPEYETTIDGKKTKSTWARYPGVTDNDEVMRSKLSYACGQADIDGKVIRSPTVDFSEVKDKRAVIRASAEANLPKNARKEIKALARAAKGSDAVRKVAEADADKIIGRLGLLVSVIMVGSVAYSLNLQAQILRAQVGKIVDGKEYTRGQLDEDLAELRSYIALSVVAPALMRLTIGGFIGLLLALMGGKRDPKILRISKILQIAAKTAIAVKGMQTIFDKSYREQLALKISDLILVQNVRFIDEWIDRFFESFDVDYHEEVLAPYNMADSVPQDVNTMQTEPAQTPGTGKTDLEGDDLYNSVKDQFKW